MFLEVFPSEDETVKYFKLTGVYSDISLLVCALIHMWCETYPASNHIALKPPLFFELEIEHVVLPDVSSHCLS